MSTRFYDTDLTDAAWAFVAPVLPAARPGGRPRTTNLRAVLNAIFYLLRTGCQWRLLPREFPPCGTVYHYFQAWQVLFQFREVPPKASGVRQNVSGVLFEGDEDARLAELARPIDQCLQGEHGFSAARTAEEEGRSISRQATAGDCIKSLDTSWHLVQSRNILIFCERSHNSFR